MHTKYNRLNVKQPSRQGNFKLELRANGQPIIKAIFYSSYLNVIINNILTEPKGICYNKYIIGYRTGQI